MDDDRSAHAVLGLAGAVFVLLLGFTLFIQAAANTAALVPGQLMAGLVGDSGISCTGISDHDRGSSVSTIMKLTDQFDSIQQRNAALIMVTGQQLDVPARGWIIAVSTAIQESSLRNLTHGDAAGPDSRGLFQQRQDWGPVAERTDPQQAARLFYTGGHAGQAGLLDIADWDSMPVAQAAQAVQRSARPQAYAEHEQEATALVLAALISGAKADPTPPKDARITITDPAAVLATMCSVAGATTGSGPAASAAIAFARTQLGQPYLWGGDGPANGENGFDCSGLTRAAYQSAGITMPRTAQQQYDHGPRVSLDHLQPGDLLFFGDSATSITHVGIYVGDDQMIDAPHRGAVVRVENYHWNNLGGATRPTARR